MWGLSHERLALGPARGPWRPLSASLNFSREGSPSHATVFELPDVAGEDAFAWIHEARADKYVLLQAQSPGASESFFPQLGFALGVVTYSPIRLCLRGPYLFVQRDWANAWSKFPGARVPRPRPWSSGSSAASSGAGFLGRVPEKQSKTKKSKANQSKETNHNKSNAKHSKAKERLTKSNKHQIGVAPGSLHISGDTHCTSPRPCHLLCSDILVRH